MEPRSAALVVPAPSWRCQDDQGLQQPLASRRLPRQPMAVGVASQEQHLEEDQGHVPDGRRAAEDRQEGPADHGLHRKEQESAQQDGRRIGADRQDAPVHHIDSPAINLADRVIRIR